MKNVKKLAVVVVIGVLAVALASIACAASKEEQVVFNRDGNALILYGGDKSTTSNVRVQLPAGLRTATKTISDSQRTYYGNSYVVTQFASTVECDIWFSWPMWAEVAGSTTTAWIGTDPQFNSSRIDLSESWTFNGSSVSVSYPGGLGFSGSSKTIRWSEQDNSGNHWRMTHIYSGLRGESRVLLTSVRQSSNGSHYFDSDSTWVSAYATDGCSTA